VENEIRSKIATSSFICHLLAVIHRLSSTASVMSYYFDWRTDAVYATLQSHEWYLQDFASWGWTRTHWDRCNPVCGCDRMSLDDIAFLLPHHLQIPPRGYVIEFPINTNLRNPLRLRRFLRPQSNSLTNIAGAVVRQQVRNFFHRANYPDWHYNDFKHAQTVLKNDYNVPPKISYSHLPPLDHHMCWCNTYTNMIIASPYEPSSILDPAGSEPEWA